MFKFITRQKNSKSCKNFTFKHKNLSSATNSHNNTNTNPPKYTCKPVKLVQKMTPKLTNLISKLSKLKTENDEKTVTIQFLMNEIEVLNQQLHHQKLNKIDAIKYKINILSWNLVYGHVNKLERYKIKKQLKMYQMDLSDLIYEVKYYKYREQEVKSQVLNLSCLESEENCLQEIRSFCYDTRSLYSSAYSQV